MTYSIRRGKDGTVAHDKRGYLVYLTTGGFSHYWWVICYKRLCADPLDTYRILDCLEFVP